MCGCLRASYTLFFSLCRGSERRPPAGDDSAVFEDVFCPCGIALSWLGLLPRTVGRLGEESKTSPCWQCEPYGERWLRTAFSASGTCGSGCRLLVGAASTTAGFYWRYGVGEGSLTFCEVSRGWGVGWLIENRCVERGFSLAKVVGWDGPGPGPISSWSQSFVLVWRLESVSFNCPESGCSREGFAVRG